MQTSSETVFHPAMGIGLTDGWLQALQDEEKRHLAARETAEQPGPCRDRRKPAQDCAYIFQCG